MNKERGILFSGTMVRAILDERKSQTRRVVKPQPYLNGKWGVTWEPRGKKPHSPSYCERNDHWNPITNAFLDYYRDRGGSPYGKVGDRLWVRETWKLDGWDWEDSEAVIHYQADGAKLYQQSGDSEEEMDSFFQWLCRETKRLEKVPGAKFFNHKCEEVSVDEDDNYIKWDHEKQPWRPSIFMPRWASRITLEVTGIRVERLQDISEEDARAEGVTFAGWTHCFNKEGLIPHKLQFMDLWDQINGKTAPWGSNPWVWVVEFKRVEGDGK